MRNHPPPEEGGTHGAAVARIRVVKDPAPMGQAVESGVVTISAESGANIESFAVGGKFTLVDEVWADRKP